MRRFRIHPALPERLAELDVSWPAVVRHSGVSESVLEQERIYVTTGELFAIYHAIAELSADPLVGLQLGTVSRIERYDATSIAALMARTPGDALQRMARYKAITCPEEIRIATRDGECRVQFEWQLADSETPPVLIDVCFAWICGIVRRGTENAAGPLRIELKAARRQLAGYRRHFGCPVTVTRRDAIVFAAADMERPFVTHNAELLAALAPQLEAELERQLAASSLGEQVKATLKRTMAGRRPELANVAKHLRLSVRTLQRRLGGEGVTFQQLVAEARRELARHYLQHSRLELNETAYLLGYEDANSFFRAFHQWEGVSPGAWRTSRAPVERLGRQRATRDPASATHRG